MPQPDDEPAFPATVYNLSKDGSEQVGDNTWRVTGMSLRDYFAAKALQSVFAPTMDNPKFTDMARAGTLLKSTAIMCYEMADAMLAARNKQQSP